LALAERQMEEKVNTKQWAEAKVEAPNTFVDSQEYDDTIQIKSKRETAEDIKNNYNELFHEAASKAVEEQKTFEEL